MPPKLSPEQIDAKLDDIHTYVISIADKFAGSSAESLLRVFGLHQKRCANAQK